MGYSYNNKNDKSLGLEAQIHHNFGIGLNGFIKYYIPINEKLFFHLTPFIGTQLSYLITRGEYVNLNSNFPATYTLDKEEFNIEYYYNQSAGVTYFIIPNVGIYGELYARLLTFKGLTIPMDDLNISFRLGLSILINNHKKEDVE